MPSNPPPPYAEALDSYPNPPHWTRHFSTGASRASRPIRGRGRGRGDQRGRAVHFTSCGECHRPCCEACQPPPARVELNIATSQPIAGPGPARQSRTFAAGIRAQVGTSGSGSRRTSVSRRSVSTARADSPEYRPHPPALPSTPAAGSPDNSRPGSPVLQPEIQLLRTIDCRLRFQVADQFQFRRITTDQRRIEYSCSCSKPKNKCTCSTAELTVNVKLRVILREQETLRIKLIKI
jgi:hypothetical protein